MNSLPTDNASVEAAWREARAIRELGENDRNRSKKRLAQAHAAKAQADTEAITATKNYYAQTRAEADDYMQQAELALAKAERIKSDTTARAAEMEDEIQSRLADVSRKRDNAREYATQLEETARSAADSLLTQARAGAEELTSRMRRDSAEDIRKILSDIEVARAAAEDELEAQRLLTETARIRAFTVGLNTQDAPKELAATNSAPKQKKVVRKVSAKRPTAKKQAPKLKVVKKTPVKKPTPIRAKSAKSAKKASARKAA